ncbi:MAG: hypothetical protein JOY78_01050 [Pseudonocardia sp.]|nr:hypothetical protein [Pseudonocardia sp.]
MNVTVIVVGLGVLVAIGVLVGAADGHAQSQAWRRIAEARNVNWADRQRQLAEQQARDEEYAQLVLMAASCDCRVCRLLRRHGSRS